MYLKDNLRDSRAMIEDLRKWSLKDNLKDRVLMISHKRMSQEGNLIDKVLMNRNNMNKKMNHLKNNRLKERVCQVKLIVYQTRKNFNLSLNQ